MGRRIPHAQPPLRRARPDGRVDLGRLGVDRGRRARPRELLRTPRDQGQVMATVRTLAAALVVVAFVAAASPMPASASVCGAIGWFNGTASKVCGVVTHADKLLNAGKKLATGHVGGAAKALLGGGGGGGSKAAALVGLAAIGTWVVGGAKSALTGMAKAIGATTRPRLDTTWFSSTYWRMAGIGAILTLPFLF